ncbi:hypothetical protein K1T71_003904 [Dendrolimus kikuchii]|uniref:Uncharacterized protein n=1 Tax=Dendrolimus kikuchii TaxID=765133 RepID=A0ACC1D9J0_9NEOP|nr:hypothetical protein K1T71_003904 [Dendrolimus kikuchii]
MDLCKMHISKLDGTNWVTWKYRMSALLRGIDGLLDIVEGRIRKPVRPVVVDNEVDGAAVLADFNKKLNEYIKLEMVEAKPKMMYHMKSIINHEEEIVLPECMYQVKNPFKTYKEDVHEINIGISDQVNKFLKAPNRKMTELAHRQDLLLKKLDVLYERIMTISSYCKPAAEKTVIQAEKNLQISIPEEVVLVASPESIPWYLNFILKNYSMSINVSWHIHSSVPNEKVFKIQDFLKVIKVSNFNETKVNLRLIFKCVAADSELKLSSLSIPIVGNVNILRYLAFAYPSVIRYDHEDYNVDSLLDLCHILERTTEKNKEAILNKLFAQCKQWIYGNQFTIVDIAAYNVIKQWRNTSKHVPKEWLDNCDTMCS